MLPAAHRLRRSGDFANAVRRGRRAGRATVVVHVLLPADASRDEPAKAGFVVSKAVGGAVVRNKVKRRLRHLVAERLNRLPAGSALVVRANPGAGSAEYHAMASDFDLALESVLKKATRR